jgi:hypothetical protein
MPRKRFRLLFSVAFAVLLGGALAGPVAADSLMVVTPSGQNPVSGQHVGMCFTACGPMSPYNQGAGDPGTVVTFGPAG